MNWTSSVLDQSGKLAIVLHFLLAPVSTAVKPAEYEVARHLRPSPVVLSAGNAGRRYDRLVEGQGFDA